MIKKGTQVDLLLSGGGFITREVRKILKINAKGAWIDAGEGNDPLGPFDAKTGEDLSDAQVPGFRRWIEWIEA